jgi:hypothetical protein
MSNIITTIKSIFSNSAIDFLLFCSPFVILFALTKKIKFKKNGTELSINDK